MRDPIYLEAVFAAALLLPISAPSAGTLIPVVAFPNSTRTYAYGINNSNEITGTYRRSDGSQHGFVGTLDGQQYSSFDFGRGGNTYAFSISDDGYIVGEDGGPSADCPILGCQYLRKPTGEPNEILRNGKGIDGVPGQIINKQRFVGEYWTEDESENFFSNGYYGKKNSYVKDLTLPFSTQRVHPRGYNKQGDVTGNYLEPGVGSPGFVIHKGVATSVMFPDANAKITYLDGLNDKGEAVGGWGDSSGNGPAFIYNIAKQAFKVIKIPGSTSAVARQINNAGLATIIADTGSFIYCSKKATCPVSPHAIEVRDTWVAASQGQVRSVLCKGNCLGSVLAKVWP